MIRTDGSAVFHRFLDLPYPSIESGGGVWLTTVDGRRVLDACSGGARLVKGIERRSLSCGFS